MRTNLLRANNPGDGAFAQNAFNRRPHEHRDQTAITKEGKRAHSGRVFLRTS